MLGLSTEHMLSSLDEVGPIFIVGCPRSGTTFLVDAVGRLANVQAYSGVVAPEWLMHLLGSGNLSEENQEHVLWSIRHSLWHLFLRRHYSRGQALLDALRGNIAWASVLRRRRRAYNDSILVYKEPFASFALLPLATHFPNSKFIHIIRDGRDCADSLCRSYPYVLTDTILTDARLWREGGSEIGVARRWHGWYLPWWVSEGKEEQFTALAQFSRCVLMWKEMVRRGLYLRQVVGEQRCLEIRYERLCANPEETAKMIVAFLGTPANSSFEKSLEKASDHSIGIYKKNQTEETIEEANRAGTPLLQELGYLSDAPMSGW